MANEINPFLGSSWLTTVTITLASLATSATLVAGRESDYLENSGGSVDALCAGKIRVGTSPTAGKLITVWVYGDVTKDASPSFLPDVLDGADSDETFTSENVRNAAIKLGVAITIDGTSDRTYAWSPFSVASLFGGVLPYYFGIFVTHNTGVNLHSSGSSHTIYALGIRGSRVTP